MPFRGVFDQLMGIWSTIAAVVFGLVVAVLLFAVVRNRAARRASPLFRASQNHPLEGLYVALLAGVVAALVFGSFTANSREHDGTGLAAAATPAPVQVTVTAFQWCWDFAYQGTPVHVTGTCSAGHYPTLVVPEGQSVELSLVSRDVIHSFWLPDFAAKRWVWPDHQNTLRIMFPRRGQWRGRCAEYCGVHHMTMDFFVRVVSAAEYQQFLHNGGVMA